MAQAAALKARAFALLRAQEARFASTARAHVRPIRRSAATRASRRARTRTIVESARRRVRVAWHAQGASARLRVSLVSLFARTIIRAPIRQMTVAIAVAARPNAP